MHRKRIACAAVAAALVATATTAAGTEAEKFRDVEWRGVTWKILLSSTHFDQPAAAVFNDVLLGALAKARQDLHLHGDPANFGQKQIDEAARVNSEYAADVRARSHFRVWLDSLESGKFDNLVRSETGWPYYVTRKNPLPPASFPVIYSTFDLLGGRKLGVAVLDSGAYEVPDPASKVGSSPRCWAGNGAGAGDEVRECPGKAYLIEADGRIGQVVDFVSCFVEFGDTSGGADKPVRDVIRGALDARRGRLAVLTSVDDGRGRKPIFSGDSGECGPVIVNVPFAKE